MLSVVQREGQTDVTVRSAFFERVAAWLPTLQQRSPRFADFGGFQSFVGERRKYEVYDNEFVSTVATAHMAARVLDAAERCGDLPNAMQLIDISAAQSFLSAARSADGVFRLAPLHTRLPTVASVYHGVHAWHLFASRSVPNVPGADTRATYR